MIHTVVEIPPIVIFSVDHPQLIIDSMLHVDLNGMMHCLKLRGIIYGGHGHFTCRVIKNNRSFWYHDGIATGRRCRFEGRITESTDMNGFSNCLGNRVVAVVYALVT
ncbi:hypothetical protein DFH06DRAFT_1024193 [Mycena polygramma]|nr:hypothetical protein DFH06DRAFT_1024193 [Mycena polygramma]